MSLSRVGYKDMTTFVLATLCLWGKPVAMSRVTLRKGRYGVELMPLVSSLLKMMLRSRSFSLARPSDDSSPGSHFGSSLTRDPALELFSSAAPGFLIL